MFSLPNARNEFPCRNKRQNGPGECGQMLYQSTTRKFASGKGMVLNAESGRGGKRDDPHVCPDRVGSAFHKFEPVNILKYTWHMQNMPCVHCGNTFNQTKMPLCPNCYRLECRKCGNRQQWIIKQGQDSTICNVCGGNCDPVKIARYAKEKH